MLDCVLSEKIHRQAMILERQGFVSLDRVLYHFPVYVSSSLHVLKFCEGRGSVNRLLLESAQT